MSRWNKKAYISQKIRSHYLGKLKSASIKENRNVYCPRVKADAVVKIKLQGQPQIQFSTYKTPYGWTISPTLAGKKVQQVLMNA